MKRGFLSASISLALLLSVLILVGDRTCRADEVWSDDFNDGNYDGWKVYGLDFTTDPSTQLVANYSAADGMLQDIGPQPERTVWSYAIHNSSVTYGTWSFDAKAVDTPSHHFYVRFMTTDPIVLNGYDLAIAVGRGLGSEPDRLIDREFALFKRVNNKAFRLGRYAVPGGMAGWQHIDITRDKSGQFCVYINGTLRIKAMDIQHTTSKYFMFESQIGPALDNVLVSDTVDIKQVSTTTATTITTSASPTTLTWVTASITTPPVSTTTVTPTPTETATYTTPTKVTTTSQAGPAPTDPILGVAVIAIIIVVLAVFLTMRRHPKAQ
ncbi:hypothetical protein [[Eubacterium] cellulosolvens]